MYMQQIEPEDGSEEHGRLVRNLTRCIREEITPHQRDLLLR